MLKPTVPEGVFAAELPVTVPVQVVVPSFQSMLEGVQISPMLVGPVGGVEEEDEVEVDDDEEEEVVEVNCPTVNDSQGLVPAEYE